ncbi:MAG: L-threonylcarbamoyladenylate synthase [Janthinobacterium lividum]
MPDPSFRLITPDAAGIAAAAGILAAGDLLAFPTETVYGLGADASNPVAIARLYAAKQRPTSHPVIIHLPPDGDPEWWTQPLPSMARALIDAFWPGPLTLILPRSNKALDAVTGAQDSVGIRCPAHPVAQALLQAFSAMRDGHGGIVAPSANRFGHVSASSAAHVIEEFGEQVAVIDGGACPIGIESTIVDLSRGFPALLRPGDITPEQIAEVLGEMPRSRLAGAMANRGIDKGAGSGADTGIGTNTGEPTDVGDAAAPRASGTLKAHYAPRTPFRLCSFEAFQAAQQRATPTEHIALIARASAEHWIEAAQRMPDRVHLLIAPSSPHDYAAQLYAMLRSLDASGAAVIIAEQLPHTPEWAAVNDRLGRAAAAFAAPPG